MIVPYAQPIPALLETPGIAQPIVVVRYSGAWMGNGLWQPDDEAKQIRGRGVVYPTTADELEALPEGERLVRSITLLWSKRFEKNDRVQHSGEEYRVVRVEPWTAYGYNKAIAQVVQLGRSED